MLDATKIDLTVLHAEQELMLIIHTDAHDVELYLKPGVAERLRTAIADGLRRLEQFKRTGEMEANRVY